MKQHRCMFKLSLRRTAVAVSEGRQKTVQGPILPSLKKPLKKKRKYQSQMGSQRQSPHDGISAPYKKRHQRVLSLPLPGRYYNYRSLYKKTSSQSSQDHTNSEHLLFCCKSITRLVFTALVSIYLAHTLAWVLCSWHDAQGWECRVKSQGPYLRSEEHTV